MDREYLDNLTYEQLRREASKYRLPIAGDRDRLIDVIREHFERHGPALTSLAAECDKSSVNVQNSDPTARVMPDQRRLRRHLVNSRQQFWSY